MGRREGEEKTEDKKRKERKEERIGEGEITKEGREGKRKRSKINLVSKSMGQFRNPL